MKQLGCTLCCLLALRNQALAVTGEDLYTWCSQDDPGMCNGYLLGSIGTLSTLQGWKRVKKNFVCLPPDFTDRELRELVLADLQAHPDRRQLSGSSLTLNALLKAFPCR